MEKESHTRKYLYATVGILLFASSFVVVALPGVVSAKGKPSGQSLDSHVCKTTLLGSWSKSRVQKTTTYLCTVTQSVAISSSLTIPAGVDLEISSGTFTIDSGSTVTNLGVIGVASGANLIVYGTLNDGYEIDNSGTITVEAGGTFNNNNGTLFIYGTLNNYGTFNNNSFVEIDGGIINNYPGGTFNDSNGNIDNYGTINNSGNWTPIPDGNCSGSGTGCPV